jgi:hypothetical protein
MPSWRSSHAEGSNVELAAAFFEKCCSTTCAIAARSSARLRAAVFGPAVFRVHLHAARVGPRESLWWCRSRRRARAEPVAFLLATARVDRRRTIPSAVRDGDVEAVCSLGRVREDLFRPAAKVQLVA